MSDELLLAIVKEFIPQHVNKQQAVGFHVFTFTVHLKLPVIQSGISSQHPHNTVKLHSLHATLQVLDLFSLCIA
jgi:hypothetical protein